MDDKKEIGYRPWFFLIASPILVLYWVGMGMIIIHGTLRWYVEKNFIFND